LRTANLGLKSTILSGGQFHPFNISVLRAGPSIALAGHPVAAVRGIGRTFRPLLPGGKGAVDRVLNKALNDGMIDKAAQIGMPYGEAGYNTAGTYLRSGVGHKLVFERQMPMMHDQVARSIIKDLEKKNIPLDSEAARQAGIAGNSTMGFINKEALNISPKWRQRMSDFLLAGQFTPSKIVTIGKVGKGGVAGKYARSDVASNAIASAALIGGIGYVLKQKDDNIKDILLRALINPAVPTGNINDKNGNPQEFRTPSTYTAELAKLFGLSLRRNEDGHLGVVWKPPTDLKDAPIYDWMRSRLSPIPSSAIKVVTNTNYASKPLNDPNAPAGQRAIQSATVLGQGFLPIGIQGLAYTDAVKNKLPGSAKQVLEADTPGTNPVLKSGLGSIGFSIRTDKTKGKAAKTADYFATRDKFYGSLDQNEKSIFDKINPAKKGPFGEKQFDRTPLTSASSYADFVGNPSFTAKYQAYQQSQKSHDPLWDLSSNNLRDYMEAQVISKYNPGGDSKTTSALYKRLPADFFTKREEYFSGLESQGVKLSSGSKPRPGMPANLVSFSESYHNLPYGTGARSSALRSATGQAYIKWLDQNRIYNNQERADLGLPPLENPANQFTSTSGSSTRRSSYRRSGGRSSGGGSSNAPQSRIKLSKGSVPSPKVSVKKVGGLKSKLAKASTAKPKVSIKKSLV
jgi:hypothetical protein